MIVVSDATPLISLMKVSKLEILRTLYGEVLIPLAVFSELTSNPRFTDEAETIRNCPFIRVVTANEQKEVKELQKISGLDLGESEAIVCVHANKADVLLIDESAGRRTAQAMGIHVQGTIGILLTAYDKKLLSAESTKDSFTKLLESNRHISQKLFTYAIDYIERKI